MAERDYVAELRSREALQARERLENTAAINKARVKNDNVTFIAYDGCEVTVTPDGDVFYNASDWW